MKYNKIVLLPIQVCEGDYCWDGHCRVCCKFSNEGGHPNCDLNIGYIKMDKEGLYPKPDECLSLKEAK